ncbi:hypothetical protein K458DRAFT_409951 [Lentithecium fluviatile CBS 122367]|uniref:Uncharacterized protein n=1 Tax=Lentithecium fluviatile CBS 122367 TaxID=1168545 RepID=A0A6G1IG19_9PLEO|nr:hypothetical protein K458DRAFT_409951 [Lentithecium fluviatile CBS 122367]
MPNTTPSTNPTMSHVRSLAALTEARLASRALNAARATSRWAQNAPTDRSTPLPARRGRLEGTGGNRGGRRADHTRRSWCTREEARRDRGREEVSSNNVGRVEGVAAHEESAEPQGSQGAKGSQEELSIAHRSTNSGAATDGSAARTEDLQGTNYQDAATVSYSMPYSSATSPSASAQSQQPYGPEDNQDQQSSTPPSSAPSDGEPEHRPISELLAGSVPDQISLPWPVEGDQAGQYNGHSVMCLPTWIDREEQLVEFLGSHLLHILENPAPSPAVPRWETWG